MKLELKHLSPYLPYGLQCMAQGEGKQQFELQGISDISYADLHEIGRTVCEEYDFEDTFPILRPLSDLTEDNADFLSSDTYLNLCEEGSGDGLNYFYLKYNETTELFKRHYDVFGLIEKGLAIDINTLKN